MELFQIKQDNVYEENSQDQNVQSVDENDKSDIAEPKEDNADNVIEMIDIEKELEKKLKETILDMFDFQS